MMDDKIIISFFCSDAEKRKSTEGLLQKMLDLNVDEGGLSRLFSNTVKFEKKEDGSFFFPQDSSTFEIHACSTLLWSDPAIAMDRFLRVSNFTFVYTFDFLLQLGLCSKVVYLFFNDDGEFASNVFLTRLHNGRVQILTNRLYHSYICNYDNDLWKRCGETLVRNVLQKILDPEDVQNFMSQYQQSYCVEWQCLTKDAPNYTPWYVIPTTGELTY